MEKTKFKAEPRKSAGTLSARALRASGRLPVIIYGHGEPPESVSLVQHEVEVALDHGARTLDVEVGGEAKQYLIKAVQYDHLDCDPIHMDLARVDMHERVTVRVGIELRGIAKGVSDGGVVDQHLADIEVECLVSEIPETLHPIITGLALGESLCIEDLELPPGVVATGDSNEKVVSVREVAEEVEPEEEAEPTEGDAQPEVIGRVAKDDEESEESKK